MSKVIFGNHMSVLVPRQERDAIRKLYCDVLGGTVTQPEGGPERDFIRLGDVFYVVLYGDVPDASELHRSARAVWLELKTDDVEGLSRQILASGLVSKLDLPDPHLYFQGPGGQCLRLVGIDEDLSFYEGGAGDGPDVAKVKEAIGKFRGPSRAVTIALAHIDAWSHHDWDQTRALLAPDVHATVTTTQPGFVDADLKGIDAYMGPKTKAAQLVDPRSVQVLSAVGDERSALISMTFKIALGPNEAMATMVRSGLYQIDENGKINQERDTFFLLTK
jgi:SnoaL-like domain